MALGVLETRSFFCRKAQRRQELKSARMQSADAYPRRSESRESSSRGSDKGSKTCHFVPVFASRPQFADSRLARRGIGEGSSISQIRFQRVGGRSRLLTKEWQVRGMTSRGFIGVSSAAQIRSGRVADGAASYRRTVGSRKAPHHLPRGFREEAAPGTMESVAAQAAKRGSRSYEESG